MSVRICFGSSFSLEIMVYGHYLVVTLHLTTNERKWFVQNAKSFWWWQCSVKCSLLFLHFLESLSLLVPLWEQLCFASKKKKKKESNTTARTHWSFLSWGGGGGQKGGGAEERLSSSSCNLYFLCVVRGDIVCLCLGQKYSVQHLLP